LTYPRYIRRKGKLYGPYYYKSVRDESGKVVNVYVGKENEKRYRSRFTLQNLTPGRRAGVLILLALMIIAISSIQFLGNRMTGFFSYSHDQRINETLLMAVGRLVPAGAVVHVQMGAEEYETDISSLVPGPAENISWENGTVEGYHVSTLEIVVDYFSVPDAEGNYTITATLAYNGTEIASASKEIDVGPETLPEVQGNATLAIEGNKTHANESSENGEGPEEIQTSQIPENQTAQINMTEPTEETVQYRAEINKPVRWVREIRLPEMQRGIDVEIPENAFSAKAESADGVTRKELRSSRQNKTLRIEDDVKDVEVEYFTEAPRSEEVALSPHRKLVTIYSEINYTDVLSYTDVGDYPKEGISLYWIRNGTRELFTNVTYADLNGNGLVDRLQWTTPHLSNQTFEVDITVINFQSYPQVGGSWTVNFSTAGEANLTITPVNGTSWSDEAGDYDLEFLEIKCGSQTIPYAWIGNGPENGSVFVESYSCAENGSESSRVLTSGHHYLEFRFGSDVDYARNKAGDPMWYDNSTNGTFAGTVVKHNVRWSSDAGLSGYVFSFYNGANWTDGDCSSYSTQGQCEGYGCTWNARAVPTYYVNTTDSTWIDQSGTGQRIVNNLTWTAELDSKYLVMAYGDMRFNLTTAQGIIQIYQGATEQFYVADRPAVASTEFVPFSAMQIYNGTGASVTYDIRESGSAANTRISTRNTRIIALRLDNLNNAQYNYTYNTAETANVDNNWDNAGKGSDYEEVTFAPPTDGYYLIWAQASADSGSATSSCSWRVSTDSGEYIPYLQGGEASWSYAREQDRNSNERVEFSIAAVRYFNSSQTHRVRMSFADNDTTASADWRDRSIVVFRLSDVFPYWLNSTTIAETSTALQTFVNDSVVSVPSGNDGNYLIIGSQALRGSVNNADFEQQLSISDMSYGIRAWRPYIVLDYMADTFISNYTGSTPFWTANQLRRQDASGTVYVKNSEMAAINITRQIDYCTGVPNYEFKNDSWVSFSGTGNWSNVTKLVNDTSGALIKWKVYANDTADNWNTTAVFSYSTINTYPQPQFTPPTLPNQSTTGNDWIEVNVSADQDLDTCILEWNGVNETIAVSGSVCYANKTSLLEGPYYFSVYVNNSIGNINVTGGRLITTEYPPRFSLNSTNSTLPGTSIEHSVYWQDFDGISGCIFSFSNCTAQFDYNVTSPDQEAGTQSFTNSSILNTYGTGIMSPTYSVVIAGQGFVNLGGGTPPTNAYDDDLDFAEASGNRGNATGFFGFNSTYMIPSDATIVGIQVILDRNESTTTGTNNIALRVSNDGGATYGGNENLTAEPGTGAAQRVTAGSTTELWGQSWTYETANKIRLNATAVTATANLRLRIEYTAINITFQNYTNRVERNTSSVQYTGIDGADYDTVDQAKATVTVSSYNPAGSNTTYNNNVRPDIELNFWNGTNWRNGYYLHINDTMGSGLLNTTATNFTIVATTQDVKDAWKFQANRSVQIRGVWIDTNGTQSDEINVTGVYGYVDARNNTINYNFVNDTWAQVAGTAAWFNVTKLVAPVLGCTVYWMETCNDTTDSWNSTGVLSYMTSDTLPPYYQYDQDNSSGKANQGGQVLVSAYWNDSLSNLGTAILRTNETGSWANRSYHAFSETPSYSNFTIDTAGHGGEVICWVIWANDSAGNLNDTMGQHCFYVNRPPVLSVVMVSPASSKTTDTLDCGSLGSDPDTGDTLQTDFTWYRDTGSGYTHWTQDDENNVATTNNVFVNTSSTGDIEPANTVKGYKFKCQATLHDDNGAYVVMNSTEVTILNTVPNSDSGWAPSSTHDAGQDFTWTEGTDDDGDTVTSFLCVDDDAAGRNSEACDVYAGSGKDSPATDVALTYGGASKTYYGRLRATDGQDVSSNYDFSFILTNAQPSAPSSASLDGQTTSATMPTITFTKGTDSDTSPADSVIQHVSVDSSGYTDSGNVYTASGDISQFTVSSELADGTYYVRQWADDQRGATNSRSSNYQYTFTVKAQMTIVSIDIMPDDGDPGILINPVEGSNKRVNVTLRVANSSRIDSCDVRIFNSSAGYSNPVFRYQGIIQNCGATCDCFREWDMDYWRNDGEWNVSVYINATNGAGNFTSKNFTYNALIAINVNTSNVVFSGIPEQTVNSINAYPMSVNNTGNQIVNMNIKGTDFTGLNNASYVVGVGNSTYNETSGGAYQQLTKNFVRIFDNVSPAGSKTLFFRAYFPIGFIQQDYQNTIELAT
jgi:hypothetical protein